MLGNSYRHIQVGLTPPTIDALIEGVGIGQLAAPEVYEEMQQALWQLHMAFFRQRRPRCILL